jgi:Na+/proline symporter
VADEREKEDECQRSKEYLERQFDSLKHLTTLNAAITVVVLTIYQASGLSGAAVGLSLMFFGLFLVGALVSMYQIMIALRVGSTGGVVPWG